MRLWSTTLLKLLWGTYLVLTSVYCLLAFLPYTYIAVIKAPPYPWMPWFVQHHALLYWLAFMFAGIAFWPQQNRKLYLALLGAPAVLGAYLIARTVLAGLHSDSAAYLWSIVFLLPAGLVSAGQLPLAFTEPRSQRQSCSLFAYSSLVIVALVVASSSAAGGYLRSYSQAGSLQVHVKDFELTTWSMISHLFVAALVLSALNLIRIISLRTSRPRAVRNALTLGLVWVGLWTALIRFLHHALGFQGWPAQLYAASLGAALTLIGFAVALPFFSGIESSSPEKAQRARPMFGLAAALALSALAVLLPTVIAGGDWNGILQGTFILAMWFVLGAVVYYFRPLQKTYSVAAILAVVIVSASVYKGLQASEILWAQPLGATDDEITTTLEGYAIQDASFALTNRFLWNTRSEECGDLCRILRQYTNVRYDVNADLRLVRELVPARAQQPDIFIFVIDSLRPDYLGAYNSQVDFTPNLDAFARDSIVLHKAFTQYAGTSLSEPAIWLGAELLHTHQLQPFAKINSLEKLAQTDGYRMLVSYDDIMKDLLAPTANLAKLDNDGKLWNQLEVCSTIQQAERELDRDPARRQQVLFYTQPKNVHQFARNHVPGPTSQNWRTRPGINNRIAYETHYVDGCMGGFFAYLKAHGLYDSSIIIFTSDHGDATGEFGRTGHGFVIYPEVIHVPLMVHLPPALRHRSVYDPTRISTLTDIAPSLYYLLGHRPIVPNPLFGQPIFVENLSEFKNYPRQELFLASDLRPTYGFLMDNGRYLYMTSDSPSESMLFDLAADPNAQHNLVTNALKLEYDERIIEHLHTLANFYGYNPGMGSLLAASH